MKQIFTLLVLFISFSSFGQNSQFRVGFVAGGYENHESLGGELNMYWRIGKPTLGFGVNVLRGDMETYTPAFGSVGYELGKFQLHVDAGRVLYSKVENKTETRGTLYLASGIKVDLTKHLYINAQYSQYNYTTANVSSREHGATVSIGYFLNTNQ
jgi:hypothetical protein